MSTLAASLARRARVTSGPRPAPTTATTIVLFGPEAALSSSFQSVRARLMASSYQSYLTGSFSKTS